jgi:hypothetical protein
MAVHGWINECSVENRILLRANKCTQRHYQHCESHGGALTPPARFMASSTRRSRTLLADAVFPVKRASQLGFLVPGPKSHCSRGGAVTVAAAGVRRSVGVAMVTLGTAARARGVLRRANRAGTIFTEGIQCIFSAARIILCVGRSRAPA